MRHNRLKGSLALLIGFVCGCGGPPSNVYEQDRGLVGLWVSSRNPLKGYVFLQDGEGVVTYKGSEDLSHFRWKTAYGNLQIGRWDEEGSLVWATRMAFSVADDGKSITFDPPWDYDVKLVRGELGLAGGKSVAAVKGKR